MKCVVLEFTFWFFISALLFNLVDRMLSSVNGMLNILYNVGNTVPWLTSNSNNVLLNHSSKTNRGFY